MPPKTAKKAATLPSDAANETPSTPQFDAFTSQVQFVRSVILMLHSNELQLHLRAFDHLDRYASKFCGNLAILYEHRILAAVWPHLESHHRFIRRFALKTIAQLFVVPEACIEMQLASGKEPSLMSVARRNYIEMDNDEYIVEYSAMILNELSTDPEHCQTLATDRELHRHLFRRLVDTHDPDVLNHTSQLIECISKHPDGLLTVCACGDLANGDGPSVDEIPVEFPFAFMLALTRCDYPRVQECALRTLMNLAACDSDQFARRFGDRLFADEILSVLETFVWNDLHDKAIQLLALAMRHIGCAEHFAAECLTRYAEFMKNTLHHRLPAAAVLTQLAVHEMAHQPLADCGFVDVLLGFLRDGDVANVALGVQRMSALPSAMDTFLDKGAVAMLVDLLPKSKWNIEEMGEVASCLATMCAQSGRACEQLVKGGGIGLLSELLQTRVHWPADARELKQPLVGVLMALAKRGGLRERAMTDAMAKGLYLTWRTSKQHDQFLVDILNCIGQFVCQEQLRDILLLMDTSRHIIEGLQSADKPSIRKATVDMLMVCSRYRKICDMLIDTKVLDCLLTMAEDELPTACDVTPLIDAILAQNLPVKFALRGHLDLHDRTANDFYATKKIWRNYRRLRQLFVWKCGARKPIILCNFQRVHRSISNMTISNTSNQSSKDSADFSMLDEFGCSSTESQPPQYLPQDQGFCSVGMGDSFVTTDSFAEFNARPADPHVIEYLRIVRDALQIARVPACLQRSQDYRRCVRIVADVVCTKLCGRPAPERKPTPIVPLRKGRRAVPVCSPVSLSEASGDDEGDERPSLMPLTMLERHIERHLDELKRTEYDCNVIPIGALRLGGFFEKSLLFKVLADQIGLPCVLHMDAEDNRVVWTEVALPLYDDVGGDGDDNADDAVCEAIATSNAERPTHIVDLMESPGELYSIGCQRAVRYLQRF